MTPENEVVAIMAYSIDPYKDFIPIIQAGRIGQTGETYAIDKTGRFVSPSRFTEDLHHLGLVDPDEPIIFNLEAKDPGALLPKGHSLPEQRDAWPWTEAASSVIKQENGESLSGIRDYRGIRVLSAWHWDEHLEIGLIAEINGQEALSSYGQTRTAILIMISTVLALLTIIVLALNHSVGIARSNQIAAEAINLAKASEEKFQSIFENVVEGIVCIDAYGCILEFNQAAERIFGYQSSETIGKNVSMLMPEPDKGQHDQYLHRYRQTGTKHIMGGYREVVGCRKDGTTFDMELALGEFKDKDNRFFVGLVRDISERKETERLLITARKKAEEANQAKTQFLSRMSHKLRTPLNGILGFSTLLGMENLSPKNNENVDRIQRSGKHLLRMINEVMNISKLDHHQKEIHLKPIPLTSVFDKAIAAMNPLASEKEVGIKVEKLPSQNLSVWAHHDYLLQVFQNLISNGIKYNKPQGSLTLSVELLPDKRVKVRIADTGIGIPESKIERLFSPFDRLDAEREQSHIEGSGLGLTLTKSLIKAMKGTISVVSKEGQGTEFSIELVGVS
jgi:PAS domain S-box-containing protein